MGMLRGPHFCRADPWDIRKLDTSTATRFHFWEPASRADVTSIGPAPTGRSSSEHVKRVRHAHSVVASEWTDAGALMVVPRQR